MASIGGNNNNRNNKDKDDKPHVDPFLEALKNADKLNKESHKVTIKKIDGFVKDFREYNKGFGIYKNTSIKNQNQLIKSIDGNTKQLEKNLQSSQELIKSLNSFINAQKNNAVGGANTPKPTKGNKGNATNASKENFDQKARLERSIIGDEVTGYLSAIKKDTGRIVELLEKGISNNAPPPREGKKLDLKDMLGGGLMAALTAAMFAAENKKTATQFHAAATAVPAIARTVAKVIEPVIDVAKSTKAVLGIKDAATAGKAMSTIGQAARDAGGKLNAKNIFMGEQKVGTLGKIGAAAGAGATYARYAEGDTSGAILQGISTALPLALAKTKFGKIANLASAGIDLGLLGRDKLKENDAKLAKEEASKAQEPASQIVNNTSETNVILREISNYFKGGGKTENSAASFGGGALALGALAVGGALLGKKAGIFSKVATPVADATKTTAKAGGAIKEGTKFTPLTDAQKAGGRAPLLMGGGAKAAPVVADAAKGGLLKTVGKVGAKTAGKLIPGVGLAIGAMGAYDRAKEGDWYGAALEAGSGVASMIPVVGTAVSMGLSGLSAANDVAKAGGSSGEGMMAGGITAGLMGGTLLAGKGIGKVLGKVGGTVGTSVTEKGIGKVTQETTEKLGSAVSKSSKSITDTAVQSNKGIAKSAKDASGKMSDTSNLLVKAGTSLKTNVEKMFGNVNGQLLGTIAKFGALGLVGAAIGGSTLIGGMMGTPDQKRLSSKLGTGDVSGTHLGAVSQAFESGNRGVGTISTGIGDHGGVSYGRHQMTAGTMTKFLNSKQGIKYKSHFGDAKAGTALFNQRYQQMVSWDGDNFGKAQKSYIDVNYFGVASNLIKKQTGLDPLKRGRALQEFIYSSSVQYGPQAVASWFKNLLGKNPASLSDAEIISKLQDYKANNVNKHFKSSSEGTRKAIAGRIQTEKQMLLNIDAKNGGIKAGQQSGSGTGTVSTKGTTNKTGANVNTGKSSASGDSGTSGGSAASKNADYDLDKICSYAYSQAKEKTSHKCALYVRKALQQGDNKKQIAGGLGDASEWGKTLPKVGWVSVGNSQPRKGDIAHIPPNQYSKIGHVCIYTGSQWVSDFKQKSLNPYPSAVPYTLYRARSGYSNGGAVGSGDGGTDFSQGEGFDGGSEGTEDNNNPDNLIQKAGNALSEGVASIFNSEAMGELREFIKGDVYKRADTTPRYNAEGEFTKDTDEYDAKRQLRGNANNGLEDDLLGALGGDEVLRQQKHADYDKVKRIIGGTDEILRQQKHPDYDKIKNKLGGTNKILRQFDMGGKNAWIFNLLSQLGIGGDGILGEIIGVASGQKSIKDINLGNIIKIPNAPEGAFGGGFGGGLTQNTDSTSSDQIGDLSGAVGGGFGGGLTETKGGSIVENADGTITHYQEDGRIVTMNKDGTIVKIERAGSVASAMQTNDKLPSESSATSYAKQYGFGGGFGGGISYAEPDPNETRVYAGDYDEPVMVDPSMGNIGMAIEKRMSEMDSGVWGHGIVAQDPSNKQLEDQQMEMAKSYVESERKRSYEVMVQAPPSVQTPTNGGEARGKTPMDGLDSQLIVKNPDTIPHALAVAMLKNSM